MNVEEKSKKWRLRGLVLGNITLVFLILFLISRTQKFLQPVYGVVSFLVGPLILSLYIFYALRPLKHRLNRYIKNETVCAVLVFLLFILLIALLFGLLTGMFYTQLSEIFHRLVYQLDIEKFFNPNKPWVEKLQKYFDVSKQMESLEMKIKGLAESVAKSLPGQLSTAFTGVGNFGTRLLLGLLCIFYLLKDEALVAKGYHRLIRGKYEEELSSMGDRIHEILKTYITGQMTVACILGALMFVGYLIIRLPYSFLMAVLALVTNFIPFIGPILGAAPAVLIALTIDFPMVLKVIAVSVIVQQLESNLITPNIMGQKLDIHPFVVIVVVLVCMNLFGVLGALIATPLYMSLVAIIKTLQKMRSHKMATENE